MSNALYEIFKAATAAACIGNNTIWNKIKMWMRNVPISFDLRCHRMLIYKYNKNNCSVHRFGYSWWLVCWACCVYYHHRRDTIHLCAARCVHELCAVFAGQHYCILHLYRCWTWIINGNESCWWLAVISEFSQIQTKMLKRQMINATHMITHKSHTKLTDTNAPYNTQSS